MEVSGVVTRVDAVNNLFEFEVEEDGNRFFDLNRVTGGVAVGDPVLADIAPGTEVVTSVRLSPA